MMRALVLVACVASAWAASRMPKEIDGQTVLPGAAFDAYAFYKVGNLTFYTSTVEKGRIPCTVVTGQFTPSLPTSGTSVELTIQLGMGNAVPGTGRRRSGRTVLMVAHELISGG